jgi:hypothetical protein
MASPYYRTDSLSLTIMIFLLGWPGRCNKNPEHWQQRIQVFIVVQRIFITPLLGALKLRYFITFYNPPRVLRRVGTAEPGNDSVTVPSRAITTKTRAIEIALYCCRHLRCRVDAGLGATHI